jgi:hypothetical protein
LSPAERPQNPPEIEKITNLQTGLHFFKFRPGHKLPQWGQNTTVGMNINWMITAA